MTSDSQSYLIAVYGTLKIGEANYKLLLAPRLPIFKGFVDYKACLYTNGSYPVLLPCEEVHPLYIEVYNVTEEEIITLDKLENPYQLFRNPIAIPALDNREIDIYLASFWEAPLDFRFVTSGQWIAERPFEPLN